jgi:hypothetical protein
MPQELTLYRRTEYHRTSSYVMTELLCVNAKGHILYWHQEHFEWKFLKYLTRTNRPGLPYWEQIIAKEPHVPQDYEANDPNTFTPISETQT